MKIVVSDVSKDFKKVSVLENVNMEFNSGNIYGLVGQNGSGKSIFLKMVCGFYKPTTGEITFDGYNAIKNNSFPPSTRALIEKPNFLPELSGFDNLKLLAGLQNKITDKEILAALKDVNLYDNKDKKFGNYSLGMKQKLGIAQVIMEDPDIIILDEPFNGIEEKTTLELRELIKRKKDEGKLIILASHIKEDIEQLVDYVYQFDGGFVKQLT